jgi:putative phosphoesterase
MLLALLSDTHDNQSSTRAALELLRPHGPSAYLHAGDLVSPEMLDLFAGLPFHFVFGNNEYDHAALRSRARAESLHCHDDLADLTISGMRIALLHGHEQSRLHQLAHAGRYHYVIHGHTHVRRDERVAGPSGFAKGASSSANIGFTTRLINPGALHRARVRSVALLDLSTDQLQFLEVLESPIRQASP